MSEYPDKGAFLGLCDLASKRGMHVEVEVTASKVTVAGQPDPSCDRREPSAVVVKATNGQELARAAINGPSCPKHIDEAAKHARTLIERTAA